MNADVLCDLLKHDSQCITSCLVCKDKDTLPERQKKCHLNNCPWRFAWHNSSQYWELLLFGNMLLVHYFEDNVQLIADAFWKEDHCSWQHENWWYHHSTMWNEQENKFRWKKLEPLLMAYPMDWLNVTGSECCKVACGWLWFVAQAKTGDNWTIFHIFSLIKMWQQKYWWFS